MLLPDISHIWPSADVADLGQASLSLPQDADPIISAIGMQASFKSDMSRQPWISQVRQGLHTKEVSLFSQHQAQQHSITTMPVVVVAGGSGDLGGLIVKALFDTGKHEVYVLSRGVRHARTSAT